MNVGKIFLSHSSNDKEYVKGIAEKIGKDRCVYDEMCFETGLKNLDEIIKGIEASSIFVLFISESSLESEWVQREISEANIRLYNENEKIEQIFHIIIDKNINHDDPMIPGIIRNGVNSYNLKYVPSNRLAYRKIMGQFLQTIYDKDPHVRKKNSVFYGRYDAIKAFKNAFDSGQQIKCIVASGIEGIGRRSYVVEVLHQIEVFSPVFTPLIISMSKDDQIIDLIMKLSDLGFGDYQLDQIVQLKLEFQIQILSLLLQEVQNLKEHVIIYDEFSLVDFSGEVKCWFTSALREVRPEVTVSILAKTNLRYSYIETHKEYIHIPLTELPYSEWSGLLRVYSQHIGVSLERTDCEYFKEVLTGYPPQIEYCAKMIKEHSLSYAKNNTPDMVRFISDKITGVLSSAFTEENKKSGDEFLAFISQYGMIPARVILDVIQLIPAYKDILNRLKSLNICRSIGAANETLEVSPMIADYVQRSGFQIAQPVRQYMEHQLQKLRESTDNNYEEFESLKYYLKETLKKGDKIPDNLLYSTIYLKSVRELYDEKKYKRVIEIMKNIHDNGAFALLDDHIKEQLQRYYCLSLAREGEEAFYGAVKWYKDQDPFNKVEYNFLRGFMFRQSGEFSEAIERYLKVLKINPKHRRALREIVAAYRGMEDYENCYKFAKDNYHNDKNNPYHIQPYFDLIIRKENRSQEEMKDLEQIKEKIDELHKIKPLVAYYEINAQYALVIEKDKREALHFLHEGERQFPHSPHIIKSEFDYFERYADLRGMEVALEKLKEHINRATSNAYEYRNILYHAHQGEPLVRLEIEISSLKHLTDSAKNRLRDRVGKILNTV